MANDDTVGIGVDLDTSGLGREAADAAAFFDKMVVSIANMSKGLNDSVKFAKAFGDIIAQSAVAQEELAKAQREALKAQALGDASAKQRMLNSSSPNGGTARDDQLRSFAAKQVITGLSTSDAQLDAQLKEAAGKLAERLIRTSEEAMRASFNRAMENTRNLQQNFGDPVALHSNRVASEYTRLKKDEANAPYASGAQRLLDEREAAAMRKARSDAEKENIAFDRAAKKAAVAQWVEANETNARIDAQARFKARQVADAEAAIKKAAIDEYRAANEENREFDRKARFERNRIEGLARQERIRQAELLKSANDENAEFDRKAAFMRRQQTLAEKDNRAFDKAARTSGLNTYAEASDENKRRDAAAKDAATRLRAEADERNAVISANRRAAALHEYDAAQAENKRRDQANAPAKPGRSFGERVGARAQLATDYIAIGAAFAGITSTVRDVVQLDDALEKFAAITQTSNTEMGTFTEGLLKIGENSRYSVKDLAEVATTLGQTGLSAAEVLKVLPNVTNLATAAGSSLQEAVDVTASIIGAYNMNAKQTADVSNVLTGALNQTKLTMSQLQQGFSYSANVAKEAGVSFTELTSVLGGLAQAGVRSGSTLGTGTRQLIQELAAPSDKLLKVLTPLGISLADIDLKANGLVGALENLRAKGFTSADALRALDLRAASAFTALAGQTDTIKGLQESLLLSNAASEGASRASESLSAGFTRLGNSAFEVVAKAFTPLLAATKGIVDIFASGLNVIAPFSGALMVLGGAATSLGVAFGLLKLGSFLSNVQVLTPAVAALSTAFTGLATASGLALLTNPITIAFGVAAAAGLAIYAASADKLTEKLDALRAKQNELSSASMQNISSTTQISSTIDNLIERREKLNSDPILRRVAIIEAQKAFGDLGLSIKAGATNIDELIAALRNLRGELATELPGTLEKRLAAARQEIELLTKQADQKNDKTGFFESRRADVFNERVAGNQLDPVLSFLKQKPSEIDTTDVRGQTAPLISLMRDLKKQFEDNDPAKAVLEEISTRLNDKIDALSNIQSKRLSAEQLDTQTRVSLVSSHSTVQDLSAQKEGLYQELRTGGAAIQGDSATSTTEKLEKFKALEGSVKERARQLITDLSVVEAAMIADGKNADDVKAALAPLRDAVNGLVKAPLATIETLRQQVDAYRKVNDAELKRANQEAQRALLNAAKIARSPDQLATAESGINTLIEQAKQLEIAAVKRGAGNPDKLSPEEQNTIKDVEQRFDDLMKANTEAFSEKRIKMLEGFLDTENKVLGAEEGKIQAQISELRKRINDPSTTVEKAKELQAQINALIQKGIDIVTQQSSNEFQKGQIGASKDIKLAPGASDVQKTIAETLAQLGRSDRLGTALSFAQQESRFNPNAQNASGATGLFQFMPKTWASQGGGGNISDVGDQVKAFVKYMDVIDAALRKVLGRDPSDFERYVGWQQGERGGADLLGANPNAKARDFVSTKAITGNGGTADMSVGDFLNVIRGQFMASEKVALSLSKKIDTDEAARAKGRATEQGVTKDIEGKSFRRDSVQAGLDQKGDEAAIKAKTAGIALTDSSAAAEKLTLEIVGMLAGELKRQLDLIEKDPKYKNDPDAKAAAISATRDQFADRFNKLAPANAKNAADQDQAVLQKKLDILETDRKTRAEAGLATGEIDKQIYALQQRLSLTEPLVVKERELATLNAEIAAAKQNGLGDEKTLADAIEHRAVLEREILALKQKQGIAAKNLASDPSFGEAFTKGSQDFFKNAGMLNADGNFKSFTQEMSGYWTEALGGMQSGLSGLFKNLASGTMKAGDAFRQFAQSVIGNMLDIASKAVSNEILKMLFGGAQSGGGGLFSGISSLFGGGGGGNIATSADMGFFSTGGIVRAATGYSTPTRDSKLIMVQPGEGIVRKSAMEMLGSQGLDEVNAMSNRRFSQSPVGSAIPRPRVPDNVNVWVAAPDQIPPPGPKDIIHVIASDIQNRGNLRQLIKQVQVGQA